eukprot:363276-Chlamydomonas_euryale.AAC.13
MESSARSDRSRPLVPLTGVTRQSAPARPPSTAGTTPMACCCRTTCRCPALTPTGGTSGGSCLLPLCLHGGHARGPQMHGGHANSVRQHTGWQGCQACIPVPRQQLAVLTGLLLTKRTLNTACLGSGCEYRPRPTAWAYSSWDRSLRLSALTSPARQRLADVTTLRPPGACAHAHAGRTWWQRKWGTVSTPGCTQCRIPKRAACCWRTRCCSRRSRRWACMASLMPAFKHGMLDMSNMSTNSV